MENLGGLVKLIDKEFGEMVKNGKFRSKEDVELVYKMIDIVKDAYCVWDYEAKMGGDYSEYSDYPMNSYTYEGDSYSRGRSMPRNRMGQFTSREGYNRGNYPRADAKSEYLDHLYAAMQSATDERTRDQIQRMIHDMEQQ